MTEVDLESQSCKEGKEDLVDKILLWPNHDLREGIVYEWCNENIEEARAVRLIGRIICASLGGLAGASLARFLYNNGQVTDLASIKSLGNCLSSGHAISTDYFLRTVTPLILSGGVLGFFSSGIVQYAGNKLSNFLNKVGDKLEKIYNFLKE